MDHIDGDNDNNQKSNFRLLCCNCHAQTLTYKGKNIGKFKSKKSEWFKEYYRNRSRSLKAKLPDFNPENGSSILSESANGRN